MTVISLISRLQGCNSTTHLITENVRLVKHELSYCKQIAHQLHTQYVEGINRNSVTLK